MKHSGTILILDFGSQYTQLIARRIRENLVYCEIHPHTFSIDKIRDLNPAGIILSGGPMSVYDDGAPQIGMEIFSLGVPVLGICYGLQLITKVFHGEVQPAEDREYGKAAIEINADSPLLADVENGGTVWMSHGDLITALPGGFSVTARTNNSPLCAIQNETRTIFGLQFHPEVVHTKDGGQIIRNFIFKICGCASDWTPMNFIENAISEIREKAAGRKAICALSGGVDSSVAALLLNKAIGEDLICVHVDTGLMRKNESADFVKLFKEHYNLNIVHIDASEKFLDALRGVSDPEIKRKIIGTQFIQVFEEEAQKHSGVEFLVQGTLYPDVIESVPVKGNSVTIKSHHNVGGLPERMNLKLIEPFRELFKDEVREIGLRLNLPEEFIGRHPFPGPGLAVRIIGEIDKNKIRILQEADDIFINSLKRHGVYNDIWQAFAVLLPVQSVGVMGDARTYENVLALRAVTSLDGMTADWYKMPYEILEDISNRIIRNVRGINRVVYDVSSKPPATIEWE